MGGLGTSVGTYTLAARIDDVADDIDTTDFISVGSSRFGTINSDLDQDFFGVDLVAGTSYIFDTSAGTLADPTLSLRNSAGTSLVFNDDGGPGNAARIEFTAGSSGRYYLDVGGFSTNTGTYGLAARVDDVSDDIETIDSVAVNGSRTGLIDSTTDVDFFSIFLTAGQFYVFDAVAGSLADPTLTLRNSAGTFLASDDDSGAGLNSQLGWTATYTGEHFLVVDGFGAGTGTYTLFG